MNNRKMRNDPVRDAARASVAQLLKQRPVVDKTTKVRAKLVQDTDTKKVSIEVGVRSNVKSAKHVGELWGSGLIDADLSPDKILYETSKIAEALANSQCEIYGDTHNPQSVAAAAKDAVRELFKMADRASTRPKLGMAAMDEAIPNG